MGFYNESILTSTLEVVQTLFEHFDVVQDDVVEDFELCVLR